MKKYFAFLLLLLYTQNASAFCYAPQPIVVLDMKPGSPQYYTHLSREEFLRKSPGKHSPNTLGLTVANLSQVGKADPYIKQEGSKACIGIKTFRLTVGYDTIPVYIDKKYKPGSCEYRVVKDHENYHVRVSQEAMLFFRSDIEKAIYKALKNVKPEYVTSEAAAQTALQNQFNRIMAEVIPVINHINNKIIEKNAVIDTPEAYAKTTALCKNW